jgi:hypothetical protein
VDASRQRCCCVSTTRAKARKQCQAVPSAAFLNIASVPLQHRSDCGAAGGRIGVRGASACSAAAPAFCRHLWRPRHEASRTYKRLHPSIRTRASRRRRAARAAAPTLQGNRKAARQGQEHREFEHQSRAWREAAGQRRHALALAQLLRALRLGADVADVQRRGRQRQRLHRGRASQQRRLQARVGASASARAGYAKPREGRACNAKVRPCDGGPAGVTDIGATSDDAAAAPSRPGVASSGGAWRTRRQRRRKPHNESAALATHRASGGARLLGGQRSALLLRLRKAQRASISTRSGLAQQARYRGNAPASRGSL